MIRYALKCASDHEFEAWFRNSATYDEQADAGLIECPVCGDTQVRKAIMAPSVATSKQRGATSQTMMLELAGKVRAHIRDKFNYVGDKFATEARAMHDGDKPHRDIYGETTPQESKALIEDGVPCAPLPPALTPVPDKKLN
tara:strand:+ start:783 stop:1205 length:423 start_codon:yes stop_codon:yes gene_type:complete